MVETKKGTISVASAFPAHQEGMISLDFCVTTACSGIELLLWMAFDQLSRTEITSS